jgi:hypothetical protein
MKRNLAVFAVILLGLPALLGAFPVSSPEATGYNGGVKMILLGSEFGLLYQDANQEIKYTSCDNGTSFSEGYKVADGIYSALAGNRYITANINASYPDPDYRVVTRRHVAAVNNLDYGYAGLYGSCGTTVWPISPTSWTDPWQIYQAGGIATVGGIAPPAIKTDISRNVHVSFETTNKLVAGPNAGHWTWKVFYQKYDENWNLLEVDLVAYETGSSGGGWPDRSPSLAVDGNGNPHLAWNRNDTVWYAEKKDGAWSPAYELSGSGNPAGEPNIDCYGNTVAATWVEEYPNGLGEILLRKKEVAKEYYIWFGIYPTDVSQTPDYDSRQPQVVGAKYVIWQEQGSDGNWSVMSNFASTLSPAGANANYPQNLFVQTETEANVYTAWTQGTAAPYDLTSVKTLVPQVPTLAAAVGGVEASSYTILRDGYLVYDSGIAVDYAATELQYSFPVNPDNGYTLQIVGYHESSDMWKEMVTIDGKMSHLLKVTAHVPETLTVKIPKAYLTDGKVDITITKKSGDYAAIASIGLMEYLPKEQLPKLGGAQSASLGEDRIQKTEFKLQQNSPNPFKGSTAISYNVPASGNVTLKVYNIAGQVVKTLVNGQQPAGAQQVAWDGKDEGGRKASAGVYVYQLNANGQTQTKRLTLLQ